MRWLALLLLLPGCALFEPAEPPIVFNQPPDVMVNTPAPNCTCSCVCPEATCKKELDVEPAPAP